MDIDELKERINRIRKEIGQDVSTTPRIKWIKDGDVLIICGYSRSDKSMLIGPGGWISGKLSEEIGKPVTVIESTEEVVSELKLLESLNVIEKPLVKIRISLSFLGITSRTRERPLIRTSLSLSRIQAGQTARQHFIC